MYNIVKVELRYITLLYS